MFSEVPCLEVVASLVFPQVGVFENGVFLFHRFFDSKGRKRCSHSYSKSPFLIMLNVFKVY